MTKTEFYNLAKGMKAVYTQSNFLPDQVAISIWFGLLQDLPYKVASAAVNMYICTNKFPPTIADIRANAMQIMTGRAELNEEEAWQLVYKAICNSSYHAQEEFDKLPETVQKAIGGAASLRELGQMDKSTVLSVEKSHFMRTYRAEVERKKEADRLPMSVRTLISQTVEQLKIEGD